MLLKQLILAMVFSVVSCGSQSQTILNGKYSSLAVGQEHYEFYEFETDKTFQFHAGASLGDDFYGNGVYHVKEDTIVLEYTTSPKLQAYHTSEIYINAKDSVVFKFQVFNLNKEEISGVNILWKEGKEDYEGLILDKKNEGRVSVKKNKDSLMVVLSYEGYQNHQVLLNRRYNYEIKVYLQFQDDGYPIKNHTEKLIIRRDENNNFILEDALEQEWRKID